jgi:hypothetical protein
MSTQTLDDLYPEALDRILSCMRAKGIGLLAAAKELGYLPDGPAEADVQTLPAEPSPSWDETQEQYAERSHANRVIQHMRENPGMSFDEAQRIVDPLGARLHQAGG